MAEIQRAIDIEQAYLRLAATTLDIDGAMDAVEALIVSGVDIVAAIDDVQQRIARFGHP